jgi:hypothetical protein
MNRSGLAKLLALLFVSISLGAAPATRSYQAIDSQIRQIRDDLAKQGEAQQPNAPGWNALFDQLQKDLNAYSSAQNERDRLTALDSVYKISVALGSVTWAPAAELRESLRSWLRPRVRIAWAARRLVDHVHALPAVTDDSVKANREKWVTFVDDSLGKALSEYDAAPTVAKKQAGLQAVNSALVALRARNVLTPWNPSLELQAALNDLYNQPNLDVSVDADTLSPLFNVNLVTTGPVTRKGYTSQVTAGPKTGFGLIFSDDGIGFYNSQLMSSVTPIWDFQQQVANNKQGKRAAKMYHFNATQTDSSELFIYTYIRSTGLSIFPAYRHNVNADISTAPQPGGGLARAFASILGFNQEKITKLAYDNAIGRIRSSVAQEAMEEGTERTSREAAQRNVNIRQYLVGNNQLRYQNVLVEGLSLRSRPENALIAGRLLFTDAAHQLGADSPQPSSLAQPAAGISADVHVGSILTSFVQSYMHKEPVQEVQTLLVETQKVEPGTPPGKAVKVTRNQDYSAFLQAIDRAKAANDPKVVALRVKRPTVAPDFGTSAEGDLVALVNDFQLEVPAPSQQGIGAKMGPPARVYRIVSPQAEFALSFVVESKAKGEPLRLVGKIKEFDAGPNANVYAVGDDETQATPLNALARTVVLGFFRAKMQGQPVDVAIDTLNLRGYAIKSVSPLDPSGWIRVNLARAPLPAAAAEVAPAEPAAGPPAVPTPPTPPTPPAVTPPVTRP